jgi:hypothetical protein
LVVENKKSNPEQGRPILRKRLRNGRSFGYENTKPKDKFD